MVITDDTAWHTKLYSFARIFYFIVIALSTSTEAMECISGYCFILTKAAVKRLFAFYRH